MDGRGLFKVLLASFLKGPCCLPYVLLIAGYVNALEAVDYPTFLVLWVLVLGLHEDLLDCCVALEVILYAILTTCVFETFTSPCVYGMTTYPIVEFSLEMVVDTELALGLLLACTLLLLSPVCVCCSMLLVRLLLVCCRLLL